jgi:hypothetical protein
MDLEVTDEPTWPSEALATLLEPAHRFLRRIVVCEQHFGDAAHPGPELVRALAARAVA